MCAVRRVVGVRFGCSWQIHSLPAPSRLASAAQWSALQRIASQPRRGVGSASSRRRSRSTASLLVLLSCRDRHACCLGVRAGEPLVAAPAASPHFPSAVAAALQLHAETNTRTQVRSTGTTHAHGREARGHPPRTTRRSARRASTTAPPVRILVASRAHPRPLSSFVSSPQLSLS